VQALKTQSSLVFRNNSPRRRLIGHNWVYYTTTRNNWNDRKS